MSHTRGGRGSCEHTPPGSVHRGTTQVCARQEVSGAPGTAGWLPRPRGLLAVEQHLWGEDALSPLGHGERPSHAYRQDWLE